jgi:hypothetical protein
MASFSHSDYTRKGWRTLWPESWDFIWYWRAKGEKKKILVRSYGTNSAGITGGGRRRRIRLDGGGTV